MVNNIITTERLILRSASDTDFNLLYEMTLSNPRVMSQAFKGRAFSKAEAEAFFTEAFCQAENNKKIGVLTLKDSGNIIGFAGLVACSVLGTQDYEIGFVLGQEHWGKGYAKEIGLGQIRYGFKQHRCQRLLALVSPNNPASRNTLKKIGLNYHSTVETEERGEREIFMIEAS